jgi:hypothetical protein
MVLTDKAELELNQNKFYKEGRKARENGKLKSSNPIFYLMLEERKLWEKGWVDQNVEMEYDSLLPTSFV